jgi:hypothetical protein
MRPHPRRVRAVVRKEMSEYRRNTNIIVAIAILPLIFLIQPLVQWRASQIPDTGPNKVRPGMEDGKWPNAAGSSRPSSRMRR